MTLVRFAITAMTLLAFGAVVTLLAWSSGALDAAPPARPEIEGVEIPRVPIQPAELSTEYQTTRRFLGRVEAGRQSQLSFERQDRVLEIVADEGDVVAEGGVIARIDTRKLEAHRQELLAAQIEARAVLSELAAGPRREDIDAARAAVNRARAQRDLAQATEERTRKALAKDAVSPQAHDEARLQRDAAAAELAQQEERLKRLETGTRKERVEAQEARVGAIAAQLETNQLDLDKSTIRAPYAGRIVARYVDEGVVVSPGSPIVSLWETNALELRIGLSQRTIEELQTGSNYSFSVGGRELRARLDRIVQLRRERSRTVEAVFLPESSPPWLLSGDMVTLELPRTVPAAGLWIPFDALTQSIRGLWSAYVLVPDPNQADLSVVERREVEILYLQGDRAYVTGAIENGEAVVQSGVHRLAPGQWVDPLDGAAQ